MAKSDAQVPGGDAGEGRLEGDAGEGKRWSKLLREEGNKGRGSLEGGAGWGRGRVRMNSRS